MRASLGKLRVQEIAEQQGRFSCCVRSRAVVSSRLGFIPIPSCSSIPAYGHPPVHASGGPAMLRDKLMQVGDVRSLCPPERICKWGHRNLKGPQWRATGEAHSVSFLPEPLGSHAGLHANQGLFAARAWGKKRERNAWELFQGYMESTGDYLLDFLQCWDCLGVGTMASSLSFWSVSRRLGAFY